MADAKTGNLRRTKWGQLKIGDILRLKKGDEVPADSLILDTSNIEERNAICYVEVTNLKGY